MNDIAKKRKIIMILLFACGVINYLDRSALSISAGHIAGEFALSSSEMGIIFSAFSVGYALFNLVGGMAADKFGPKDTLLVAVIVWSLFSGALIFTALAFFAYNYILFFFLTWFPSYLQKGLGMGLEEVSLISVIPWTFGFVAIAIGGIIADKITDSREWKDPLTPKRLVLGICLLISGGAVIVAANTTNFILIIAMITVSVFALYFTGGIYWGVVNDIVDSSNVGSIGGAMHAVGNCAGILGPAITGFIVQATDSFIPAFILAGMIGVLGALGALINVKKLNISESEIALNKK